MFQVVHFENAAGQSVSLCPVPGDTTKLRVSTGEGRRCRKTRILPVATAWKKYRQIKSRIS